MYEVYSEVQALLSSHIICAIKGCVLDAIRQCVLTAKVEQITSETSGDIQYWLKGTLDGILIAKTKLEELMHNSQVKRQAKETDDVDSTTLSEENSSLADEGNTSYDKETTDKTSCVSDDKERDTNASSNGYLSATTESRVKTQRPKSSTSKKLRFLLKDRPKVSPRTRAARLALQMRTQKKKGVSRNKSLRVPPMMAVIGEPERLSVNLQHMKLATEESDLDSAGPDSTLNLPVRTPCKVKNYEAISPFKHFCELCSFKTRRSSHFQKHMATHDKVLSCPHCSYQTTKQHYYERHQRLHCSKRLALHQCSQCCYRTHRREHYLRHVSSVHGDARPFLCHICGRTFKRGDALQQHQLTHGTENAVFKCQVCEKQFRSHSHLQEHQAVHSETRTFLCELCGACFKTRAVHRKHVQSVHRNPRCHPCDICSRRFSTPFALRRHLKTHKTRRDGEKIPINFLPLSEEAKTSAVLPSTSATQSSAIPETVSIPPTGPPEASIPSAVPSIYIPQASVSTTVFQPQPMSTLIYFTTGDPRT